MRAWERPLLFGCAAIPALMILLGFALVGLPLIIALINSALL